MTISSIDASPPDDAPARATNAIAISAVSVSKRYGSITALDRLTLDIRCGEVFGLLGPNGSGKTTFMRLLAGYLLPSAGRLTVAGLDTVRDSLAVRRRIGFTGLSPAGCPRSGADPRSRHPHPRRADQRARSTPDHRNEATDPLVCRAPYGSHEFTYPQRGGEDLRPGSGTAQRPVARRPGDS